MRSNHQAAKPGGCVYLSPMLDCQSSKQKGRIGGRMHGNMLVRAVRGLPVEMPDSTQ